MTEEEFPKVLNFDVLKEGGPFELKLEDGSVIRMRAEPSAIIRIGNDPNTGLPTYMIPVNVTVSFIKLPRELIKKPSHAPAGAAYR